MPLSTGYEAFSISHLVVLDGTTGAEDALGDIYGVRSASVELDQDSYDNTGDDTILSSWFWGNKANLTVQTGYVPFKAIERITGSMVTSSAVGGDFAYNLPLWEERQMNTTPVPVLARMPSKDAEGVVRTMDFIFYKVQFQPMSFDGPSYKEGLLLNLNGSALFSTKDEKGNAVLDSRSGLPTKAIGRIVNKPL